MINSEWEYIKAIREIDALFPDFMYVKANSKNKTIFDDEDKEIV